MSEKHATEIKQKHEMIETLKERITWDMKVRALKVRTHIVIKYVLSCHVLREMFKTEEEASLMSDQHVYLKRLVLKIFLHTTNSEIFARVLFLRNFAGAKFRENKSLAKWRNQSVVY